MILSSCLYIDLLCHVSTHFVVVASVAVVKSRDLHWSLLAQKDHKDINLSSLRLLLVSDGANPCKLCVCVCVCSDKRWYLL